MEKGMKKDRRLFETPVLGFTYHYPGPWLRSLDQI